MSETVIDLRARGRAQAVAQPVGRSLLLVFALVCLADFFVGREQQAVRIIAGVFGAMILLVMAAKLATRNRRPRWLGIDHEGLRIMNRHRADIARFAWGDLAGVGLMTNESARRRQLFAAALEPSVVRWVRRWLVSVPIWLELFPAGPDAVRRHPELPVALEAGTRNIPGREQRWMLMLSDGWGQDLPVAEFVQRHRPDLWRGHRSGSALFG